MSHKMQDHGYMCRQLLLCDAICVKSDELINRTRARQQAAAAAMGTKLAAHPRSTFVPNPKGVRKWMTSTR